MSAGPMTPKQFAREMSKLSCDLAGDIEIRHSEMDKLMCSLLIQLGYSEGAEIFQAARKWYA